MAAAIEIEFDDQAAQKWLSDMLKKTQAASKANKAYADILSVFVYQDVTDHFEKELGPDGGWQVWSKAYEKHMQKIGKGSNKILQDSGRLRNTFTPQSRETKGNGGIIWYNNAKTSGGFPYAAAHNDGGPTLPKREFMWLSNQALDKMGEASLAFILGDKIK